MKIAIGTALALALFAPGDLELGKEVPDMKLKSVDGKERSVAELSKAGKVIVILSWSNECPSGRPCMPRAKEIAEKYAKNDKVAVIGVSSYGDTADAIKSYLKDNGLEYPVVCDADKSLGKTLGAKQVNSAYVISGGKLFWRGGMHKAGRDSVVEAVDAALGGKEAPASDKPFNG